MKDLFQLQTQGLTYLGNKRLDGPLCSMAKIVETTSIAGGQKLL
jgi:hypothetical protein